MRIEPKFSIGERVYSALPESPVGIVTDITYRFSSGIIGYEVAFDPMAPSMSYQEYELSKERVII